MRSYILLSVLCWSILCTVAQTREPDFASNYLFSHITIEDGLPSNFIDDIYEDSQGFIWVSTNGGGLLRYDSHYFLNFNTNSALPLKSNYIRQVCEDNFNRLWIATERGTDVMDLLKNSMTDIVRYDSVGMTSQVINMIRKDSKGGIWAASSNCIFNVTFLKDGQIRKIRSLKPRIPLTSSIGAIYEFENQILVGINNTIYKITADDYGQMVLSEFEPKLSHMECFAIKCMIAKDGELWIGTTDGLYRFNPFNNSIKTYFHDDGNSKSLTQNMISDIKVMDNGSLVISTLHGINFYNPMTDDFNRICAGHNTLNNDFVNCLLPSDHTLWIGTEAGGLNKMTKPMLSLHNYVNKPDNSKSLASGPVNSVYVDDKNNLWVGCIEGGLNLKRNGSTEFVHFTTANGLSHNSVSCIVPADSTTLWLGTWGGGISIFNTRSHKSVRLHDNSDDIHSIDFVGALILDTLNNGMWIGSTRGIFFYDLALRQMMAPLPSYITSDIEGCLGAVITTDGLLLMGCTQGIIIINLNSFKKNWHNFSYQLLKPSTTDNATAFLNKTTFLFQSSDGTVWIGTDGYGMIRVDGDITNQYFTPITTDDGLTNNIVCHIQEDKMHKLWVSTANGINCYSPSRGRISNFYIQDGLCVNQFFWNGACCNPLTGNLLFGGISGLVEIDAERFSHINDSYNVILTRLMVDNQAVTPQNGFFIQSDISVAKQIYLHERNKQFTIEFSALNYNAPLSVLYQYRLIGFNNEWTTIAADRRFASYTNLSPGNYTFQVRCATGPSEFFSTPTEIKVSIEPYYYKTWWFILMMVSLILMLTMKSIQWRVRKLKKQNDALEAKIEQRTAELENKTEELQQQNEILFNQNEEILRQKNQLEQMTHKVQELTVDKLAFFTNITHEFRTPLTLIIGPIERALKLSSNPKVIEQLEFVSRNSQHLLSLVNQLMDFRKVESGNMPMQLTAGNFRSFMDDMLLSFRALTSEKNINLRYLTRMSNDYIMFDREAMTKIITNLMGNAVKFTPKGGTITVYTAELTNPTRLYICVTDTGKGVVEEDMEKIFNRYFQSKGQEEYHIEGQSGTGIGLYLCKQIINQLGGDITASNSHTHGAVFRILMPIDKVENESVTPSVNLIDDDQINSENLNDQIEDDNNRQLTMLIVEDSNDMRSYLRSILTDNYQVLEASCGKDALKLLRSRQIDLVISDLMMPEMNGIQLAKIVKGDINISHIPFIMLTAKTAREAMIESLQNGVDDYILKPFDEAVLKAKIAAIIENRRRYQQAFKTEMDVNTLNISEDSSDKKFIDKAMQIVRDNYKNSYYEVGDFVKAMGVSKTLLNKKMQSITHQSAGQFIRNYRLKVARDLIIRNKITKNMNISEIAYEVGFNDPKYFTRCFTKHFDATPSSLLDSADD